MNNQDVLLPNFSADFTTYMPLRIDFCLLLLCGGNSIEWWAIGNLLPPIYLVKPCWSLKSVLMGVHYCRDFSNTKTRGLIYHFVDCLDLKT